MKIRFLKAADRDLRQLYSYIAEDNPTAARNVVRRIRGRVMSLTKFPEQGSPIGRYRHLLVSGTPYVVYYRVVGREVRVSRVFHGRQRRP